MLTIAFSLLLNRVQSRGMLNHTCTLLSFRWKWWNIFLLTLIMMRYLTFSYVYYFLFYFIQSQCLTVNTSKREKEIDLNISPSEILDRDNDNAMKCTILPKTPEHACSGYHSPARLHRVIASLFRLIAANSIDSQLLHHPHDTYAEA